MNKMATRAKNEKKKKKKKIFTLQTLLNILTNFNQTSQEYCLLKLHKNVARLLSTKLAKSALLQWTRRLPDLKQIFKWQLLLNPLDTFNLKCKTGY